MKKKKKKSENGFNRSWRIGAEEHAVLLADLGGVEGVHQMKVKGFRKLVVVYDGRTDTIWSVTIHGSWR